MPKRQPRTLNNPDLVFYDKACVPILELNIGNLPEEQRYDWLPFFISSTKDWIKTSKFRGKGTIWTIINPSMNFESEWTQSALIIVQGFRENFFEFLYQEVKSEWGGMVTCLDQLVIHEDIDGWNPVVYVEQGRAFIRIDAEEWMESI